MRISDWSSDVCSSDLITDVVVQAGRRLRNRNAGEELSCNFGSCDGVVVAPAIANEIVGRLAGDDARCAIGIDILLRKRDRPRPHRSEQIRGLQGVVIGFAAEQDVRSEEHTSELQSLMRISYAVF